MNKLRTNINKLENAIYFSLTHDDSISYILNIGDTILTTNKGFTRKFTEIANNLKSLDDNVIIFSDMILNFSFLKNFSKEEILVKSMGNTAIELSPLFGESIIITFDTEAEKNTTLFKIQNLFNKK